MRALVTGAGGFVGPYLVRLLLLEGYQVFAGLHKEPFITNGFTGEGADAGKFHPLVLDMGSQDSVDEALSRARPDEVYHLAVSAKTSGVAPERYYQVNFQGTFYLLEAVAKIRPQAKVLYVGSANCYGVVRPGDLPVREDHSLTPNNHYAASKAAGESLACAYAAEGLHIVRARPFNHTGPRQSTDYVSSRLAREVALIALGMKEPVLEAGNLDSARDFTDVRDVVSAYRLLLKKGGGGQAYNVCSQESLVVRDIIDMLLEFGKVKAAVRSPPSLERKVDIPVLVGSREKIFRDTGWEPRINFGRTLQELLAFWLREAELNRL